MKTAKDKPQNKPQNKPAKLKQGRPTKYKKEYDEIVFKLGLLGAIDEQICKALEINNQTLYDWKKRHPSFAESLKIAKDFVDANVAQTLYKRAQGYEVVETKTIENEQGTSTITTTRHIPADVTAMIFWLKNRQPKLWRDKIELKEDINFNILPTEKILNNIYDEVLSEAFSSQNLITNRLKKLNDVIDGQEIELKDN